MVIYNRENQTFEALDFRESAPGRMKSNAYDKDYNASRYGECKHTLTPLKL